MFPLRSNRIDRDEVVPWSKAKIWLGSSGMGGKVPKKGPDGKFHPGLKINPLRSAPIPQFNHEENEGKTLKISSLPNQDPTINLYRKGEAPGMSLVLHKPSTSCPLCFVVNSTAVFRFKFFKILVFRRLRNNAPTRERVRGYVECDEWFLSSFFQEPDGLTQDDLSASIKGNG